MADTLFDVVRKIGETLSGTRTGLATGGSTTTVVDTRRSEPDDAFNKGTALIIPNSQWSVISDWALSSKTATLYDTLTAISAGNRYMFILPRYPLDQIIDKVNTVLTRTRVAAVDTTSLDMTADQTEYTLPTGVTRSNLRQVWVATNNDTNKNEWMRAANWHVEQNGTTHTLIFETRIDRSLDNDLNGYGIKLVSTPYHSQVTDADDTIDDSIHLDRIVYPALKMLLYDDFSENRGNKWLANQFNFIADEADRVSAMHPIHLPEWHERGSGW